MTRKLVIDASVAIKWTVQEADSAKALELRSAYHCMAPELIFAECANIIWKKARAGHLTAEQAALAAQLVGGMDIEIVPLRELVTPATALSLKLDHAAYDCIYFCLALRDGCRFVTADRRFHDKVRTLLPHAQSDHCIMLEASGQSRA